MSSLKTINYLLEHGAKIILLSHLGRVKSKEDKEKYSLEIVAKNCFVSVNELCRLFKKHMGTTVNKYITSRRITEAKKLLKNGVSVSFAAEKCGFMDYASFIRSFKRAVGVPPGQYKKGSEI